MVARPITTRSIGDIQTALRQQIFGVAIAERETHIKPNGVPDDLGGNWWRANEMVMDPSYPSTGYALPFA